MGNFYLQQGVKVLQYKRKTSRDRRDFLADYSEQTWKYLTVILMANFVMGTICGLAYWFWFGSCSVNQKKVDNVCVPVNPSSPTNLDSSSSPLTPSSPTNLDSSSSPLTPSSPRPPNAEQVLEEILQKFSSAPDSQRALDDAFKEAEEKFPTDYRFTYERIKLHLPDDQYHHHHEAFLFLKDAATRAIKSGQAPRMLERMKNDINQNNKIKKLSLGHQEWRQVIEALEQEDTSLLKPTH